MSEDLLSLNQAILFVGIKIKWKSLMLSQSYKLMICLLLKIEALSCSIYATCKNDYK